MLKLLCQKRIIYEKISSNIEVKRLLYWRRIICGMNTSSQNQDSHDYKISMISHKVIMKLVVRLKW